MTKYDIIFWGWDGKEKHRKRDPMQVELSEPLSVGQVVHSGVLPHLDRQNPERPVEVFEEGAAENAGSAKSFHVVESKPKQKYPGIPAKRSSL